MKTGELTYTVVLVREADGATAYTSPHSRAATRRETTWRRLYGWLGMRSKATWLC